MPPRLSPADSQWLRRQALSMLLAALALLAVFENTLLDVTLESVFFDPASKRFPGQGQWFFADLLHHGLKSLSLALGVGALAVCGYGIRGGISWLPPRSAWLAGAGMVLIPLLTTGLKQITNRHCPWDVVDFGGYAPYVHLFATTPDDLIQGTCFPAGHASAGFVWLVWAVALRATRPRWASAALVGSLLAGALMGYGRMAQGAHFLSHVLWSAWLAWALSLALAACIRAPVREAPRPAVA
jgi:membrane-associated PAP2 superfamily phosphatase